MIFIFSIFIIVFIIGIRFTGKDFNREYINKESTTIINGLFVVMVFFSHFKQYLTNPNIYDNILSTIMLNIGQLMVTSFLFYSGYGIYESIKNKPNYMKSFFKKRFIPTYLNFFLAMILFVIMNIILKEELSFSKILLSFIGYESIGNSNWYMLATFALYIFIIICFTKNKKMYSIIAFIFLCFLYVTILRKSRPAYFVNTIFCFPVGILYSYYKERIEKYIFNNYFLILIISILSFIISCFIKNYSYSVFTYSICAILFILMIVIISMKIKLRNRIYLFFGKYIFWIYVLQRIPMIFLRGKMNNYLYFFICFVITIIMSITLKYLTDKIYKKIIN